MRARHNRHDVESFGLRQVGQVKPVRDIGKPALRPRRKSAHVKGKTIAQKLDPHLLARPQSFVVMIGFVARITAEDNRRLVQRKIQKRSAIRPFALGKQQMKFRGIEMRRR